MTENRKSINYSAISIPILLVIGLLLVGLSFNRFNHIPDSNAVAQRTSRVLEKRMDLLDQYMQDAHSQDISSWVNIEDLPKDMVVYRYCNDTLQSWVNEFPIANDDIRTMAYMPFVSNPRISFISPLNDIGPEIKFLNLGPKWYLTKSIGDKNCRVLAGLEIYDSYSWGESSNINPALKINSHFSIRAIGDDIGTAVTIDGQPIFILTQEQLTPQDKNHTMLPLTGLGVIFIMIASIIFLQRKRSFRNLSICSTIIFGFLIALYFIGRNAGIQSPLFSPVIYADGIIIYSLGALLIINLALFYASICAYIFRHKLCGLIKTRKSALIAICATAIGVLLLFFYNFYALHSIITNSSISLQIYKFADLTYFCILVYGSFLTVLTCVPLLLQTIQSLIHKYLGWKRFDAFSLISRITCSIIFAAYLVSLSAVLGLRKEQQKMEVLAKRLSFDRDIALETRLRWAEDQIADDMIISALSVFNNTASSIKSRLSDYYFPGDSRNYDLSVYVINSDNDSKVAVDQYNRLIKGGVPIQDGSRFLYVKPESGHSYYIGVFLYLIEDSGVSRVLIRLEGRDTRGNKGYAGIFGFTPPGMVSIPNGYSYARYNKANLTAHKGNYAYSMKLSPKDYDHVYVEQRKTFTYEDNMHFCNIIGDNEAIIISRAKIQTSTLLVAGIFIALISFFLMSMMGIRGNHKRPSHRSYYRNRIFVVLMGSLSLIMLSMAIVSVVFVYSRNDINQRNIMTDKISSISSMLEAELGTGQDVAYINLNSLNSLLETVGRDTNSDISLYTASGRLITSTTPIVFETNILGNRIDGYAYSEIYYKHKHHYITKEHIGDIMYYNMYAPILDKDDKIVAIISSPYNEDSYDLEEDAVNHSMTMMSIFLLFLLMALFFITSVVDTMFNPLIDMSNKMDTNDKSKMELIEYDRNDEISPIIAAYNRMVLELEDSTQKLAQAERDKAWSEMARQVAHEIKNPLTPMKLQLQRVMRLKQKGDEAWMSRFDEASKVLLDHIDILTDTANEFSTFAKLYTEENTRINLDKLIKDEITMFDNKDNIRFDYMGLSDVFIMGPKPQLTRVFVNLINNSIQAIGEKEDGVIFVSLRNSTQEGYYDIVVEDNGPGVSEDNEKFLFTPNFTTKNGGSGLGLAISRSILHRCNASISYSRSFGLGGASFCITYPKEDLVA